MYYLYMFKTARIASVNKVRLYSSCLTSNTLFKTSNFNTNTNKKILNRCDVDRRHFSGQNILESIAKTQAGIFQSLSESTAVAYTQEFLTNVHSASGLPWWASIMLSTILLRSCVTVPLAVYQNYIMAKLENLQLEMPAIVKELKKETTIAIKKFKWDEKQTKIIYNRSLKKQWNNLIIRDNCHPFKASLLLWFQLPMWICLSISFRNLCYMLPKPDGDAYVTFLELTVGGFGWMPNLVEADTSLILPVTLGLVNLTIIEIQAMSKTRPPTKLQKYLTNFFRGVSLLMIPISAGVPSCLTLYWVTSSVFGLFQNLVLMSPKVKRISGVPKTSSEIEKPYSHIVSKCKERFSFKKNVDTGG